MNIMRQSACLVVNQIMVVSYVFLLNCTAVGQAYFESGHVVQEEMSFKIFLIWSSDNPPIQWSRNIYAFL